MILAIPPSLPLEAEFPTLSELFYTYGQEHVFEHWYHLTSAEQDCLLQQAAQIDFSELQPLLACFQSYPPSPTARNYNPQAVTPAPYLSKDEPNRDWQQLESLGEQHLRAGKVAALTVAGGIGSRLGFSYPKGMLTVTPVKGKALFQLFAERIKACSDYFATKIPWVVMTSPANQAITVAFFEKNHFFGLDPRSVHFIVQGLLPMLDSDGKFLLKNPHTLALYPDGHGGAIKALLKSGTLAYLQACGIDTISYFQVDNPLVQCLDPTFIGLHVAEKSDFSSKTITKACPHEKVGVFCKEHQQLKLIEYLHFPPELSTMRTECQQHLRFRLGNMGAHLLDVNFIQQLTQTEVPVHCIPKVQQDTAEDARSSKTIFKLERFIFDLLPFARNPVLFSVKREEEFSPIKNQVGLNSLQTAQASLVHLWHKWFLDAGIDVPLTADGQPAFNIEISPLFAPTQTLFKQRLQLLNKPFALYPNFYLE